jgi:hypothetical protein
LHTIFFFFGYPNLHRNRNALDPYFLGLSPNDLSIHQYALRLCFSPSHWQPFDGMSVEERPWWYDEKEGKSGSTQADIECKLDILKKEADDE